MSWKGSFREGRTTESGEHCQDGDAFLPLPPQNHSKAHPAYFLCKQVDSGLDCSQTGTASASLDTSVPVAQELGWTPISRVAAVAQDSNFG